MALVREERSHDHGDRALVAGIVDEATIDRDAGTLPDEQLETCFRESMMSMAFAPPPHGGTVTVIYPFTLAESDPDARMEGGP